jgi:hypothetical protein
MPNLPSPPDSDPPPVITPYFRLVRRELDAAARRRGLPPEPWAA